MRQFLSLLIVIVTMAFPQNVRAFDYSAVSPSGHTLYYTIRNGEASVVRGWQSYTLSGNVIIPDTVTLGGVKYAVVSIGDISYANNPSGGYMDMVFAYDSTMTGISLPNTIRNINALAFLQCKGLQNVVIPNSVTKMGDHAFAHCENLTSIVLSSSLEKIEEDAFVYCNSLVSVDIPEGVKELAYEAFASCATLHSVTLPSTLEKIGENVFAWTALSTIVISSPINRIPRCVFRNCTQLSSVVLPEGLQYLDMQAFASCTMLNSITVPSTVDTILNWSEINFTGIQNITMKCPPTISVYYHDSPGSLNDNIVITVPCELLNEYNTASGWGSHEGIVGDVVWNFTIDSAENGSVLITTQPSCNEDAMVCATPNQGYHFVGWSDGNTNNPRAIHLTSDTSLSATFVIDTHIVTLAISNEEYGEVSGAGSFIYGSQIEVSVTPNCGFQFIQWSNGVTENPYTFVLISDTSLEALVTPFFDTIIIHDTTFVNVFDTTFINVTEYDTILVHDTAYIDIPMHDTTIVKDTSYLPVYFHDTSYIAVHDTTTLYDTLTVTEYIAVHDTTILKDTIYFPVYLHDTAYVAVHDTTTLYDTLTVTEYVAVHDTTYLDVLDTLRIRDTVEVNVYIYDTLTEYIAVHDTTIQKDTLYLPVYIHDTAYMAVHDTTTIYDILTVTEYIPVHDTTIQNDTLYFPVYLYDTSYVAVYDTTTLYDTITEYVYVDVHDTAYINIHDTSYVDVYVYDTAYIDVPYPVHDTSYIIQTDTLINTVYDTVNNYVYDTVFDTVYDTVNNYVYDTVTNTIFDTITNTVYDTINNYIYDTTLVTETDTLTILEYDTIYITLYDTVYIHDTIYIQQEGIDDPVIMDVKLYQCDGMIVVEGAEGHDVKVFDAVGRMIGNCGNVGMRNCVSVGASATNTIAQSHNNAITFAVPTSGVYLVKIGDAPARRIVVIR